MYRQFVLTSYNVVKDKFVHLASNGSPLIFDIEVPRGKTIGCWCKLQLCHGGVLLDLLQDYKPGPLGMYTMFPDAYKTV